MDHKGITRSEGKVTGEKRDRSSIWKLHQIQDPPSQDVCEGDWGAGLRLVHLHQREASSRSGLRGKETKFTPTTLPQHSHVASV